MGRKCTVCQDTRRPLIDKAMIKGTSLQNLIAQFGGLSRSSFDRHRTKCLPGMLAKSLEEDEVVSFETVEAEARALVLEANKIRVRAGAEKDNRLALLAIREARASLELVARITGELTPEREPSSRQPMFALPKGTSVTVNLVASVAGRKEIAVTSVKEAGPTKSLPAGSAEDGGQADQSES